MLSERKRPFKVNSESLLRINLFEINKTTSIFLFQFHHAILDGWSLASLNTELFQIYRKLEKGEDVVLKKLKITNRDAVIEERVDKKNEKIKDF
jgi:hypothetical protein